MRLLFVDGDAGYAFAATKALQGLGFAVDRAANGDTAISMARHSNYHLILVGDDLPGAPSSSVCHELRAQGVTALIALLVSPSDASPLDLADIGIEICVSRSVDVEALGDQVRRLLESRSA